MDSQDVTPQVGALLDAIGAIVRERPVVVLFTFAGLRVRAQRVATHRGRRSGGERQGGYRVDGTRPVGDAPPRLGDRARAVMRLRRLIPRTELRRVQRLVEVHEAALKEAWHGYFGG